MVIQALITAKSFTLNPLTRSQSPITPVQEAQEPAQDYFNQEFQESDEAQALELPPAFFSALISNLSPTSSNTINSTATADKFFLTQWGDTPSNAGDVNVYDPGNDAPYGYSDCVPTSGVMALSALGLIPHPTPEQAEDAIDSLRDQSLGYDSTSSAPMDFSQLAQALDLNQAQTNYLDPNDLNSIDTALANGHPVLAAGNSWGAWGQGMNDQGQYLNHQNPGDHAVCILGKTPEGKYIVGDPLSTNGTIEVTGDQLSQFFNEGGSSGAMEVSRKDGQGNTYAQTSSGSSPKITAISPTSQSPLSSTNSPNNSISSSSSTSPSQSYGPVPQGPFEPTTNLSSQEAWVPVNAPITGNSTNRSPELLNQVIDQFDVANNPRYAQRDGNTYCNIFAWDVTRAMGAEIPHYRADGSEMDANGVADWLAQEGGSQGWHPVSEQEAQAMANQGKPVVVSYKNPTGIGHIGVIRPGEMGSNGPNLAQAGATNTNNAYVHDDNTFGNANIIYYAHD